VKKLFIVTSILFASSISLASGKVMFQNTLSSNENVHTQTVGLSMYEKINLRVKGAALASDSFVGYGVQALEEKSNTDWFVAKTQVDVILKNYTYSLGVLAKTVDSPSDYDTGAYLKLSYKLW